MRAYIPIPANQGHGQKWVVLSIDEERHCEAFEILDSFEECLAEVERLNALNLVAATPAKRRLATG
ncbi:MAG: hypothetical protein WDN04_11540 [Rhodospirillales bacterium]